MQVALGLARRGLGATHPNPAVGCILVRPDLNNRVIGRGWTQPGGRPHAETVALKQAGEQAKGATAYVTLEPCCHHGETPPCSDALINAGVTRAVIAIQDRDPRVAGNGVAALQASDIPVSLGVCGAEASEINAGFLSRVTQSRPYFTLKTATTLDGKIATSSGDSQWITGPEARAAGHALRATHDAVLTGIGTVIADDPTLNCRLPGCKDRSPIRVILDSKLSITPEHAVIRSADEERPVWIFAKTDQSESYPSRLPGVRLFLDSKSSHQSISPVFVAETLAREGLNRVLIESGGTVAASFVRANLVDEIVWFRSASLIGGDGTPAIAPIGVGNLDMAQRYECISARQVGADMMETYRAKPDGA